MPGTATREIEQLNTVGVKSRRRNRTDPPASGTRGNLGFCSRSTAAAQSEARALSTWVTVRYPAPQLTWVPGPSLQARARHSTPSAPALYLNHDNRAKTLEGYFLDSTRVPVGNMVPQTPSPEQAVALGNPKPGLAKLLPGKLFSPTTVGGYYDENGRGMSIEPEFTAEL
jgi:hypothetical protein